MIVLVLFTPVLTEEELTQIIDSHHVYNTAALTRSFIRTYHLLEGRISISFSTLTFVPIQGKDTHIEEKIDQVLREFITPEQRNTMSALPSPSVKEITLLYQYYYYYQLETLYSAVGRRFPPSKVHTTYLPRASGRQLYSAILHEKEPVYTVVDGSRKYPLEFTSRVKGSGLEECGSIDYTSASKTAASTPNSPRVV